MMRRRRLTSLSESCAGAEEEKTDPDLLSDNEKIVNVNNRQHHGHAGSVLVEDDDGYGQYDDDVHDDEHDQHGNDDSNDYYRHCQRRHEHQQQQQYNDHGIRSFSLGCGNNDDGDDFDTIGQTALQQKLQQMSTVAPPFSISLRGGVRGGHSVSSHSSQSQTLQQPPSTASSPPPPVLHHPSGGNNNHRNVMSSSSSSSIRRPACGVYDPATGKYVLDPKDWPKGLTNVGNTCYANAALQCLLSTALTSALMDPKAVPILRRYSSNPNLLAQGSGSVDSEDDDDEEDIVPATASAADGLIRDHHHHQQQQQQAKALKKKKKLHKKKSRNGVISGNGDSSAGPASAAALGLVEDESVRKERERRKMEEKCQWLTQELTNITHEYMEETPSSPNSNNRNSGSSSSNGFSSGLPLYGGRSSMMGWSLLSSSTGPNDPYDNRQQNSRGANMNRSGSGVVNPGTITRHPERLSKCLRPYQQEDAHEFMRALLSTLVMNGQNRQLSSLFDGLLESSVKCKTCGRASLTRDRYMDLSLDIHDADVATLDDALYEFTKTEVLSDDNAVYCQKCRKKRSVTKGLRLATAPSILVCHLKRFAFDAYGRLVRLHKRIEFPNQLEIGDFMSDLNKARPPPYELVGVLVHQGQTCASGHYLSFVKKNGEWFKCNDSEVTKVDENIVMMQQAYILMYEVAEMRKNAYFTQPGHSLRKELSFMHTIESDDAEMSKDEASAHASHWSSSERSASKRSHSANLRNFHLPRRSHAARESPAESLIRLLRDVGVTQFISDLCCDSSNVGADEPETQILDSKRSGRTYTMHQNSQHSRASTSKSTSGRRRRRHDAYAHECESVDTQDSLIRRQALLNNSAVNVLEVERKRTTRSHRAQTAPRQRSNSYENAEAGFDMVAPFNTYTPRAGPTHRKFSSYGGDSGGESSTATGTTASSRRRDRNRSRSSRLGNANEREELPPLHSSSRRGQSSGPTNRKSSTKNID